MFLGKEPDDNSYTCNDKIFETEEAAINHYVNLVNGLINKGLARMAMGAMIDRYK